MTEFEVATHLECLEPELENKLRLFVRILEDLGVSSTLTAKWVTSISWESDGSGFGHLGNPVQLDRIRLHGDAVTARPYVLGYTAMALPGTTVPWVQLSLVFQGEWETQYFAGSEERWQYVAGIGRLVYSVVQAYTRWLPDSAVFFNDSSSVNTPWYALLGTGGNVWAFDLASVPASLEGLYRPVPDGYARKSIGNRMNFARMASWQVIPWDE